MLFFKWVQTNGLGIVMMHFYILNFYICSEGFTAEKLQYMEHMAVTHLL